MDYFLRHASLAMVREMRDQYIIDREWDKASECRQELERRGYVA